MELVPEKCLPVSGAHIQTLATGLFISIGAGDLAVLHPAMEVLRILSLHQVGSACERGTDRQADRYTDKTLKIARIVIYLLFIILEADFVE